jgi:regulator of protease activity HflC (stomatin/prohibitin superfamily)
MTPKKIIVLSGIAVASLLAVVASVTVTKFVYVESNELGIKESWSGGIDTTPIPPGMQVLFPGMTQKVLRYQMSPNIFVMNDRQGDERANGRNRDAYIAKSADNQTMTMWLALQWRFDPEKIVDIHKAYRTHTGMKNWDAEIEERLIRQVLMRETNTEATKRNAIDAYSGAGFVALQQAISDRLTADDGELRSQGIIIENFVIEKIELDADYIGEINQRQVAQQRTLRARAEEEAALAEAARAEAQARADYNKQVVEAEREKQKVVLASEGAAQQQINDARAQAERVVVAAKAEEEAAKARASAILAIGEAEAEAQRLRLSAYAVDGADAFVQIEVAKSLAVAFQNIKGYLPENMKINLLSDNFLSAVRGIMSPTPIAPAVTPPNARE